MEQEVIKEQNGWFAHFSIENEVNKANGENAFFFSFFIDATFLFKVAQHNPFFWCIHLERMFHMCTTLYNLSSPLWHSDIFLKSWYDVFYDGLCTYLVLCFSKMSIILTKQKTFLTSLLTQF